MPKCILNENNWCKEHQMFHNGRSFELSQMENELGEKYRKLWSEMNDNPDKFKPEKIDTGCEFCDKKDQSPGFFKKAFNFTKAVGKRVAGGFTNVTEEQKSARLKTCEYCIYRNPKDEADVSKWTCSECGCYLNIKSGWASEDCPKGLWPKLELPQVEPPKPQSGGCGGCKK